MSTIFPESLSAEQTVSISENATMANRNETAGSSLINRNEIAAGPLTEEQEIYKENILDHYKHPRNKRQLAGVICQRNVNPLCGDQIIMYLDIHKNMLKTITFMGQGCAISQAAASMLTEELYGKTIVEVQAFTSEDMLGLLGIPVSPVRQKCALLALTTVQQGVHTWCLK